MSLGKLGVWAATDGLSAPDTAAFARRVEAWGYGALWFPEAVGREAFSASAWLLANTSKLIIASGIANIYARDACSAAAARQGLCEQSGGRFLLGLGVSHIPLVEGVRKHAYGRPLATMPMRICCWLWASRNQLACVLWLSAVATRREA